MKADIIIISNKKELKFMNKKFKCFKEADNLSYEFIKAPRALFYDKKYASLSPAAKLLYLAMLERQSLSLKNKFKDDEGNIYIIFTHEDAREVIGCGVNKAVKAFNELDLQKGVGLIRRKRQGLCKPDLIYLNSNILKEGGLNVNKLLVSEPKEENRNFENESSGNFENKTQELSETKANYIKENKNKINNINPSYPSFDAKEDEMERKEQKENIKFNIDYDALIKSYSKDILDEIVSVITNAVCTKKEYIFIGGENIPSKSVKQKLLSLDQSHIEYVCNCLDRNTTEVKNINSYILTCLYRAADNISLHYKLMINHLKKEESKKRLQS